MKFFTVYKWNYKVQGYTLFSEDLEVEVIVEKDKTWKVNRIGFLHHALSGPGYIKIWFDNDDPVFKIIENTIINDPKFAQSVLNETL